MMIRLIEQHGILWIPRSAIADLVVRATYEENENALLIVRYRAGDIDTIEWPNPNMQNLVSALFDAREIGRLSNVSEVELPDGTVVQF